MIASKRIFVISIFLILAALASIHGSLGSCYMPPSPDENEERIFAQDVCGGVINDPPNPTVFTLSEPRTITKIGTYHWNQASGDAPGTIGLQDENGRTFGPWQASGVPGQGGVPNAYWIVSPGVELPAGTYTIQDSNPATWAYDGQSQSSGIASVIALKSGSGVGKQAPCKDEGKDYSPRSPTNQYDAGPSLVPGSYNIWYGKRTGTNIGKPDSWKTVGPVELLGGKFYVFDVTAGTLLETVPQMINPMLSQPLPSESLVWLRLSTEDPYVVCFEGPLEGGLQLAGAWKMAGHQEGFNDWKADLNLKKDGSLEWTETQGANVGAKRQGTWTFDGTTISLNWNSPGGGRTNWVSQSVTENTINGGTYTVEAAPGGTWSAQRVTEGF
jgi:hypothetical protein